MSNPGRRTRTLGVSLALLMGAAGALADGGEECMGKRPKSPEEKKAAQDIVAALKAALPAAPRDWKLVDITEPRRPAEVVFTAPGCTEAHAIKAIYRNDRNALAGAQSTNANAGRMDQIMAEFQAAMAKGDARKINELNAEMARIQSGGAAGGSTMSVSIEVNNRSMAGPDAKAQPVAVPGVPLAFRTGEGPATKVVLYLGASWQAQGRGAALRLRRDVANSEAQMAFVSVNGESAEAFARLVNVAALNAVLK